MDRIISDRYAEALFSLAVENNAIDRYEEQVKLVLRASWLRMWRT